MCLTKYATQELVVCHQYPPRYGGRGVPGVRSGSVCGFGVYPLHCLFTEAGAVTDNAKRNINPFLPTVQTFAVRETDVFKHNGGTSGAPLKALKDDSALRALLSLRGLSGAPEVPQLCRETLFSRTANVGTVGMNWLN